MSEVSVKFSSDDAQLWAAIQRQIAAAGKQREGLENVAKAGGTADAALRRFADATNRIVATPVERYQTEIKKLDAALKANLITKETHTRAVVRAETQLNNATAATTRHVAAQSAAVNVGGKLVGSIASIAASYLSLDSALSALNRTYQDHLDLQAKAAENRVRVGKAQQDALKNLTGLPSDVKADILTRQIAEVQLRTGFPSRAALTEAAGAGFSASGDIKATLSATEVGATMNLGSPDQLQAFVSGALLTAKGTGIQDAQQNASFLLGAGSINLMSDPNKLATRLGPLIAAGAEMLPRQDRREASREIGALFGTLAREAGDKEGDKTATAQATLMGKLDRFFSKRADDPGTLFGRLGALQSDASLRGQFWGPTGFGEEQIKPALQRLITGGTGAAAGLAAAKEQIGFGSGRYQQFLAELSSTPEVTAMVADAKMEAALEINRLGSGEARAGQMTRFRDEALKATRRGGLAGGLDFVNELLNAQGRMLTGGEGNVGYDIALLQERKDTLLRQALPAIDVARRYQTGGMSPDRLYENLSVNRLTAADYQRAAPFTGLLEQRDLTRGQIEQLPVSQKTKSDLLLLQQAIDQIWSLMKPPAPAETPATPARPAVSEGAQLHQAGRDLQQAASDLRQAVIDLRRGNGPLPDFTSRGRREQAAAVG